MSCPANPPAPAGFHVWRGAVPTELTQWAMDLRDHVAGFPYGQTWTMQYQGATVTARKDYHTFTWRNGVLVTAICIPGITLYQANPPNLVSMNVGDPLSNPDGTEAVFGADDVPPPAASTDWGLVVGSGVALAAVVTLFALALRGAGRAAENPVVKIHKRSYSLGNKCGPDPVTGKWVHRGGCHPARPLCRVSRLERGVCTCSAYHFPHRRDRNTCGPYAMPVRLRREEQRRHTGS